MKLLFTIGLIYLIYKVSKIPFRLPGSKEEPHDDEYIDYEEVDE